MYMYICVYVYIIYSGSGVGGGWGGRVRLWTPTVFFKLVKFTYVNSENTENIGLVGLSPVPSSVQKISGSKMTT